MTAVLNNLRLRFQRLVIDRVEYAVANNQQLRQVRFNHPVLHPHYAIHWNQWMNQVQPALFVNLNDLFGGLFAPAPQHAPVIVAQPDPPRRVNDKHLLPEDLRRLRENNSQYVCHRTSHGPTGRCEVAIAPENDVHRKKNPMAPEGIWATIGVRGNPDYGKFGVVIPRSALPWRTMDPPSVLYSGGEIAPHQVYGWFHQDDWDESLR